MSLIDRVYTVTTNLHSIGDLINSAKDLHDVNPERLAVLIHCQVLELQRILCEFPLE